jgi:hypothetical protein
LIHRTAPVKIAIASLISLLRALGLITWWALESSGVAVLEARTIDGSLRSTHVRLVPAEPRRSFR